MAQHANTVELEIGGVDYTFAITNAQHKAFINGMNLDLVRSSINFVVASVLGDDAKAALKKLADADGETPTFVQAATILAGEFTSETEVKVKKSMKQNSTSTALSVTSQSN